MSWAWVAAATCAAAAALSTVFVLSLSSPTRIPDYVEAFLLMCARRVSDGAPLYIDPLVGAHEYGPPPSRWYVGYALPFSAVLAYMPGGLMTMRLVCGATWVGLLGLLARGTPSARRSARVVGLRLAPVALVGAFLIIATFRLSELAFAARPDVFAVALSTLSLRSALNRARVGMMHSAFLALAVCVKPSVWGLFAGVLVHQLVVAQPGSHARRAAQLVAPALAVFGAFGAGLHVISGGAWLQHYRVALLLSFHWSQLLDALAHRVPFVAVPLALGALALWGARKRATVSLLAAAFTGSLLVAMVGMGKTGAALNYMMEPLAISVLAIAVCAPGATFPSPGRTFGLAVATGLQVAWLAPVVTFESFAILRCAKIQDRELHAAADVCDAHGRGFALSSRPGVEWRLNGRIHIHPLEFQSLIDAGRYPAAAMAIDASRASCFVDVRPMDSEAPAPRTPEGAIAAMQPAVSTRFVFSGSRNGVTVYLPRKAQP
jgi:hypothetical protein